MTKTLEERFWEKVKKSDDVNGCWLWTAGTNRSVYGYGQFWVSGSHIYAHRFSYELATNEIIPDDKQIDHICCNPLCVNPAHLQVVTKLDNLRLRNSRDPAAYKQRLEKMQAASKAFFDANPTRRQEILGKIHAAKRSTTHCANGHLYTEESTYTYSNGARSCRICRKEYARKYWTVGDSNSSQTVQIDPVEGLQPGAPEAKIMPLVE